VQVNSRSRSTETLWFHGLTTTATLRAATDTESHYPRRRNNSARLRTWNVAEQSALVASCSQRVDHCEVVCHAPLAASVNEFLFPTRNSDRFLTPASKVLVQCSVIPAFAFQAVAETDSLVAK